MSRDSSEERLSFTSLELQQSDQEDPNDSLPSRSQYLYEAAYKTFNDWKEANKMKLTSEAVLLSYFNELTKKYKPTSLWSIHSMLKSTIKLTEKIDISTYSELSALLKKHGSGFKSKKSNVLTPEQIDKFLSEASDYDYLATKVALIFGISGGCRKQELTNVKVQDITKQGDLLVVKIPTAKLKEPRIFIIDSESSVIVKKYKDLRPENVPTDRFFLNYRNGKCTIQVIGVNKFAKMPQQIAIYLKLSNPELYTGHCFRRSSATLLSGFRSNIATLKLRGRWKSSTVTEEYIEESVQHRTKTGNIIVSATALPTSLRENGDQDFDIEPSKRPKIDNVVNADASSSNDSSSSLNEPMFRFVSVGASNSNDVCSSFNEPMFRFENCSVTIINNYPK